MDNIFSLVHHTLTFSPFSQCVELGEIIRHAEQTVQNSHLKSQHREHNQCYCGWCVIHLILQWPQITKHRQRLCIMACEPSGPVRFSPGDVDISHSIPNLSAFCIWTLEKLLLKCDSWLPRWAFIASEMGQMEILPQTVGSNLSLYPFTREGHQTPSPVSTTLYCVSTYEHRTNMHIQFFLYFVFFTYSLRI